MLTHTHHPIYNRSTTRADPNTKQPLLLDLFNGTKEKLWEIEEGDLRDLPGQGVGAVHHQRGGVEPTGGAWHAAGLGDDEVVPYGQ